MMQSTYSSILQKMKSSKIKITQVTSNSFQMSPSDPRKPASNFQEESGLEQNHILIFKQCEVSWF